MTVIESVSLSNQINGLVGNESDLPRGQSRRILIYSPDTFGLGQLRRCLKIATAMKHACSNLVVLLVTGNPHAGKYPLPDGIDLVKLPSLVQSSNNQYRSRSLKMPIQQLIAIRQNLIYQIVRSFKPHLMLVDRSPLGFRSVVVERDGGIVEEQRQPRPQAEHVVDRLAQTALRARPLFEGPVTNVPDYLA